MKHNWTYKKLGELVDVLNGYAFKSSNYVKDGIRVIRIANVQKGKIVDEAPAFYPLSAESELTRYMLHEDDILLSLTGNVGRVGLLPKEMLPAALNQRVACLRIKDDTLMFKFLYQFLNSDYFEQKCIESSRGIAQLNMSTEWLKDYPLPIPSLAEQQSIVAELDGINRLIDLQEEQLREYDKLAQSLFYTTFGEEEKWQKATLKDICSSIIRGPFGSALKKDFFVPKSSDTYKVYEQKHAIQKNATIGAYYITKEKFEELKRFEVFPEDIIMSCSGTIGELFVIPLDAEKGVMNQALLKFHLNELATIPYFLFVMEYVKSKMTVQGCGLQNIGSVKEICKIDFPLPPLALQQTFAAQIEAIEQQKALIRKSLEDTRTLLAARMQYYFNA